MNDGDGDHVIDDESVDSDGPAMERVRRLAQFWSWLPAFRVVAELEHLPSAATRMGTSASALSRSVRLLEDAVGVPLFARTGRRLVLSDEGRVLLAGTRDAMRLVDDALRDVTGERLTGTLRIAVDDALRADAVQALTTLLDEEKGLKGAFLPLDIARSRQLLLRGELDVALHLGAMPDDDDVTAIALGHVRFVVVALPDEAKAFVSYPHDPWPETTAREIRFVAEGAKGAADIVRAGGARAFLPETLLAVAGGSGGDHAKTRRFESEEALLRVAGPTVDRPALALIRPVLRPGGPAERYVRALERHRRGPATATSA